MRPKPLSGGIFPCQVSKREAASRRRPAGWAGPTIHCTNCTNCTNSNEIFSARLVLSLILSKGAGFVPAPSMISRPPPPLGCRPQWPRRSC